MIVLNDGLSTFISSSGQASSTIDLSIASRNFGLLASASTLQDLYGSDYFPVSISVACTSPSMYRFSNRLNLSDKQLASLHSRLSMDTPQFHSYISSSATSLNPLQMYEKFCTFLTDNISLFFPHGIFPPKKKLISHLKSYFLLGGTPHVRRQLNLVVLCFVYTKPPHPSTIGLPLSVGTYNAEKYSVGRKGKDGNSSVLSFLLRFPLPLFGDLYGLTKINLFLQTAFPWMTIQKLKLRINCFQTMPSFLSSS